MTLGPQNELICPQSGATPLEQSLQHASKGLPHIKGQSVQRENEASAWYCGCSQDQGYSAHDLSDLVIQEGMGESFLQ